MAVTKDTLAINLVVSSMLNTMSTITLYGNTDAYAALANLQANTANSSALDKWFVNTFATYVKTMYPVANTTPPANTAVKVADNSIDFVTIV